ncbi:hypothetical protein NDY24_09125 [Xanthomonas hortorum pv. pelargonii]|nr:hypothetical protein NDY24_09125 [Xanthomonas hortorum pv. pelargonii]
MLRAFGRAELGIHLAAGIALQTSESANRRDLMQRSASQHCSHPDLDAMPLLWALHWALPKAQAGSMRLPGVAVH